MLEALIVAVLVTASAAYSIWHLLPEATKGRLVKDLERRTPSLAGHLARRRARRPPARRTSGCDDCRPRD